MVKWGGCYNWMVWPLKMQNFFKRMEDWPGTYLPASIVYPSYSSWVPFFFFFMYFLSTLFYLKPSHGFPLPPNANIYTLAFTIWPAYLSLWLHLLPLDCLLQPRRILRVPSMTKLVPNSRPLHLLFPMPGKLFPQGPPSSPSDLCLTVTFLISSCALSYRKSLFSTSASFPTLHLSPSNFTYVCFLFPSIHLPRMEATWRQDFWPLLTAIFYRRHR